MSKFGSKFQNCQFKLKFGNYAKSIIQNSMVVLIFFRPDITFLGLFSPKNVELSV